MKLYPVIVMLLIFLSCIIPAVEAGDNLGQYSYINIKSIDLNLSKDEAVYNVNYTVDSGIQFLVLFLGKTDLKTKLCRAINIDECTFEKIDMDHAIITVKTPSLDNGDGSLWFPRQTLLVTVPEITVKTPRIVKNYSYADEIPGMGYFSDPFTDQIFKAGNGNNRFPSP